MIKNMERGKRILIFRLEKIAGKKSFRKIEENRKDDFFYFFILF